MEWVETTGRSLDQAKDLALDQLGVAAEDAEFEVLEEPRTGLFGRVRGEARVRARVRPATVRPKQERRRRRPDAKGAERSKGRTEDRQDDGDGDANDDTPTEQPAASTRKPTERGGRGRRQGANKTAGIASSSTGHTGTAQGETMSNDHDDGAASEDQAERDAIVDVGEVRQAAEAFAVGLVDAFGLTGSTSSTVDGTEIEVRIDAQGDGLGLLIGPGGRTLLAIQDLARVAAQRRLGDHETRLRIDVAGYREKRRIALERFARNVADLVKESGIARSLDPMPSADRKVIHDTLTSIDGVVSRSEGEDPNRRIIVSPA